MVRYDSRSGFVNRDMPKQMFETKCSRCKQKCKVPFKPSGNKAVYCKECYEEIRE